MSRSTRTTRSGRGARAQPVPRRRLVVMLVVLALCFSGVVTRLTFLQGVSATSYAELGQSQRLRRVQLPAERGSILDRNGTELAMTIRQRTVWANPRLVTDPGGEARALAPVLGVDEAVLRQQLSGAASFVYLARKVDDAVADRVGALRLPGIAFLDEPERFAPAGALASSVLGQVGVDNEGLTGLELQHERSLRGSPGELVVERDPHGNAIEAGVRKHRPSRRGDDLVLTLDRSMQYEVERALGAQVAATGANGGMVIVMDPRTGAILAMASLETDEGGQVRPAINNLALTTAFEPGSVNKVVTVSGAMQEGLLGPSDSLVVPDHLEVGTAPFQDHEPHPTRPWTVTDIVANSSNIGTIMIGQKLGKARVDGYLRAFGLGAKSGLGFPGETPGLLLHPSDWTGPSIATVSIGQGLAVTALQMLLAFNTIATGGEYVAPRLVERTVDTHGRTEDAPPSARRRVVSPETAGEMTGMLDQVVRTGTGTSAAISGYSVAGKTGTARKSLAGAKGYAPGAYLASFAGFVPAESPQLSAIVVLDEPKTEISGGAVSGPVFATVAQYGLRLLRIPPPDAVATRAPEDVPPRSTGAVRRDADVPDNLAPSRSPQP